jgi:diacylglycerol kinase family enzyme
LSDEGRAAQPVPGNALYGAVVASYGFHATLVADSDTEEWRKKGSERFGMVAKELLFPADGGQPYAYKARVALLSQESQRLEPVQSLEHEYVLVTMVSNLERTFTISPLSRPLDGTMRVVHFGPGPGAKIMKIMQLAYQGGKHVGEGLDLVSYEEIDGLRLDMLEVGEDGRWRRVCIDGMIVRIEEGGWMEVRKLPKADSVINVIIRPVK